MDVLTLVFIITFSLLVSNTNTQQIYSGQSVFDCETANATLLPNVLYACNGEKRSCQSFLIFRSKKPYNSINSISKLTSSSPLQLARANNVSKSKIFANNAEVIVPVKCSCSNMYYYQANSSYHIKDGDTYYTTATITYQGLAACSALVLENVIPKLELEIGSIINVPLRCACPTKNQTQKGKRFLLTYVVNEGDDISTVSEKFNVDTSSVVYANGFSDESAAIHPLTTILIPLSTAPSPLSNRTIINNPQVKNPRNLHKGIYAGIGIGVFAAVLTVFMFICLFHRKKEKVLGPANYAMSKELVNHITNDEQALKVYDFEEIQTGTEHFSPKNRISSLVYRGVIRGQVLCVKKMGNDISKEVGILKKINHFNLITLHGACENRGNFYLIYEYMENGSLQNWLKTKPYSELRSWNYRIQIALDVANGLLYLHNFTNPVYVHKDINTSNVLLDRDLRAKIANFTLARSAENGISLPKCAQKTRGYIAPEYIEDGLVTPKVDVYAFGVLLLELITGKEAVFEQEGDEVFLSEVVLSIINKTNKETDFENLIDPRLQVKHPLGFIIDQSELALRMIKLAVSCLGEEPKSRPSMGKVVSTLMRIQMDEERSENWSLSQM